MKVPDLLVDSIADIVGLLRVRGKIELPSGSVAGAALADGAVTTTKLADLGATNVKLAADVGRENQLVNGGFEIWQRGAGTFTASNTYCADRWLIFLAGTSTISVSRDTGTPDTSSQYALQATYVHNAASFVSQKLEHLTALRGRTLSLSVRVRCATANAVRVGIDDGTSFSYSAYHSGSGSYETLTVTRVVSTSAPGSLWAHLFFGASCTAWFDNASLVVGAVAADYVPLHPADDLARCVRYYQRWNSVNGYTRASGVVIGSNRGHVLMPTRGSFPGTPSLTVSAWADFNLFDGSVVPAASSQNAVYAQDALLGLDLTAAASTLTLGRGCVMYCANGTGWIALEFNP